MFAHRSHVRSAPNGLGRGAFAVFVVFAAFLAAGCEKKKAEEGAGADKVPASTQPISTDRAAAPAADVPAGVIDPPVEAQPETRLFAHKASGFSIRFPMDWTVDEKEPPIVVQATSQQENVLDDFGENVYVLVDELTTATRLDVYVARRRANLPRFFADVHENDTGFLTINGNPCMWVDYSMVDNDLRCRAIRYYLLRGKWAFIITCTSRPRRFAFFKQTFEDIAKSFRLE